MKKSGTTLNPLSIGTIAGRVWPVTILVLCVVSPWMIIKVYRELKNSK